MPAQNIECQLALGQIGRYITGDLVSDEAVKQLEEHVADCLDCQQVVAQRRRAIQKMLGDMHSDRAVVQMTTKPAETSKAKAIEEFTDRLRQTQVYGEREAKHLQPDAEPKPANSSKDKFLSKPLIYCSALAVVLIAMSYFSRTALQTFGPSASQMLGGDSGTQTANPPKTTQVKNGATTVPPATNVSPSGSSSANPSTTAPATNAATTVLPTTNAAASTQVKNSPATNTPTTSGRADTPPAPARPTPSTQKPEVKPKAPHIKATPKAGSAHPQGKPLKLATAHTPKVHVTVQRADLTGAALRRHRLARSAAALRKRNHRIRHASAGAIRVYDAQGHAIRKKS